MQISDRHIDINDYYYNLPSERIAKFPLAERSQSKLLVYDNGEIHESHFARVEEHLPAGAMLVFNNTRVVRARVVMHKASGARIEVFCLEPHSPADYERAFAMRGESEWSCVVGNLKKWKGGEVIIDFEFNGESHRLSAEIVERGTREHIVRFRWTADLSFGELLELLGRIPIPPYLNRDSEDIDNTRYQTVYAKYEGSVAAPTAGLHFTPDLIASMRASGFDFEEVTLHVGAGTFLPVKDENAEILVIAAKIESDIAELESYEERQMFLEEMGLEESGVVRLIQRAYSLLNLRTYFTAGSDECRAWTINVGDKAPKAAGVIHTDFEKGFIRAEVIKYEDFVSLKSEAACRAAGKLGVEGKEYVVQDGDIMHFLFNV